jgi:hypothetical protein
MEKAVDSFECSCTKAARAQEFCESCSEMLECNEHLKWRREVLSIKCNCARKIESGDLCDACSKVEFDRVMRVENYIWFQTPFTYRCYCARRAQDTVTCELCSRREFERFIAGYSPKKSGRTSNIGHISKLECPMCVFLRNYNLGGSVVNASILADFNYLSRYGFRVYDDDQDRSKRLKHQFYSGTLPIDGSMDINFCACRVGQNKIDDRLIKEWLKCCDEKHQDCLAKTITRVPGMRVIDCYDQVIVPFTIGNGDYIALSYVWGISNAREIGPSFELGDRPKLVQDAMLMVRRLGFRYLWVDRYCIPQNDEKMRQVQIQYMGKIYNESSLTIIVAAGSDPDYGIPGVSSTLRTQRPSIIVGHLYLVGICPPVDEISESKWNTRGWTYQEALLSRRRLVFTDTQAYFQCQVERCTDAKNSLVEGPHSNDRYARLEHINGHIERAFPLRSSSVNPGGPLVLISGFIRRNLSRDSDALDAIAGVLTAYYQQTNSSTFVCGLPLSPITSSFAVSARSMMEILCEALSWSISCDTERRSCFPSWTWAGWKLKNSRVRDGEHTTRFDYPGLTPVKRICTAKTIEAEFLDEMMLSWEHQHERILELSSLGIYPISLRINGWTFHCQVGWDEQFRQYRITHPRRLQYTTTILRTYSGNEQRLFRQLLGLILLRTENGGLQFLLVEQEENGDRFERLDQASTFGDGELIFTQGPGRALWADIELELKEICLV